MADEDRLVGDPSSFDPENLARVRGGRGIGDALNLERALWALEYAAQLEEAGLDFLLKGGTAVQLVTDPSWPRFSIDVDICTGATKDELEEVLSSISERFVSGFEFQPRKSKRLDAPSFISYRITTPPIGGPPQGILLDVHLSLPGLTTLATPLRTFFYDSPASVTTPSTGGLLGDKLTTIPSSTVGRRIVDSRQGLDYAKHVFDIHRLVRSGAEPGHVKEGFETVLDDQNRLRGTEFGPEEVIRDLVVTCQAIATIVNPRGWRPAWSPPLVHDLEYLQRRFRRGVKDLRPFLTGGVVFGVDEFVTAAGEAALIALSTPSVGDIGRTVSAIVEGVYARRSVDEAVRQLGEAGAEMGWFIDLEGGLYSRSALGTWAEVARRLAEE